MAIFLGIHFWWRLCGLSSCIKFFRGNIKRQKKCYRSDGICSKLLIFICHHCWSQPVPIILKSHAYGRIVSLWKNENIFSWRSESDSDSKILKNIHLSLTTMDLVLNYCLSTEINESTGKNSNTVVWLARHYCSSRYNHPEQTLPGLIANFSRSIWLAIPVHL